MKRWVALAVGLLSVGVLLLQTVGNADAQRRRRRGTAPPANLGYSAEISKSLGDIRWQMTSAELRGKFEKAIQERYRPQIAKAPGAIEEDRLRTKMASEIQRIRDSYVRFNGQNTGWEVSFLADEFTHNNGEALLVTHEERSQNFWFFINDKLWKKYIAFNADFCPGCPFEQFRQTIEQRFGRARPIQETNEETGTTRSRGFEWFDDSTRLRAVDNTQFYGVFCLVFEDKATLRELATLRRNPSKRPERRNALIEGVTAGGTSDSNADVIDRLTGRRLGPASTVPPGGSAPPSSRGESAPSQGLGGSQGATNPGDADPLRGLDL